MSSLNEWLNIHLNIKCTTKKHGNIGVNFSKLSPSFFFGPNEDQKAYLLQQTRQRQTSRVKRRSEPVIVMTIVANSPKPFMYILNNLEFLAALYPTLWLLDYLMVLHSASEFRPDHTNYPPNLLSWPTWTTKRPDIPTHLTYPPICPIHPPDFKPIHPDNLPEPTDKLPEPTDNLREQTCSFRILTKPYQSIPNHVRASPNKFNNFDKISQFWQNF